MSICGSTLAHGLFGWHLSSSRLEPRQPDRRTFDVRMVQLPPPAPPAPAAEPPKPEPPPPAVEPPKPKPRPSPKPEPTPPPEAAAAPAPSAAAPEPTTAPPALLAESGAATGGIVQRADAVLGAFATASRSASAPRGEVLAATRSVPLAKLSDLSRKPKAPSLDAALRDNYPPDLRRRGTEGQAEVRVVIDGRGRVGEVAVLSESAPGFAEACRRTLLGSRWSEPLDREGRAVSTRLTYRCRFEVEK